MTNSITGYSGYSLWLTPANATVNESIQHLINQLSHSNNTTPFNPHLTLLTRLPDSSSDVIQSKVQAAVNSWRTKSTSPELRLAFKRLSTSPTPNYYQYIYIAVELQSNTALLSLRKEVRDAFFPPSTAPDDYFPHLSLLYGADDASSDASLIMEGLKRDGRVVDVEEKLLVEGRDGFEADEVWVVNTEGEVADWKVMGRVTLSKDEQSNKLGGSVGRFL